MPTTPSAWSLPNAPTVSASGVPWSSTCPYRTSRWSTPRWRRLSCASSATTSAPSPWKFVGSTFCSGRAGSFLAAPSFVAIRTSSRAPRLASQRPSRSSLSRPWPPAQKL
ncbi:Uncharacterised protein [Mycobacteroides abscessus]|nr:Uncharacterised protein [Mycobacteroides abscessus]